MAIKDIRIIGDPVLRTKCEEIQKIDNNIKSLVTDLLDTVNLEGRAGLAANQIGVLLRAFSYNVDKKIGYILNPVMKEFSDETQYTDEGCLSLPELSYKTTRSDFAKVEGIDLKGEKVVLQGYGLMAKCIQHEMGHLDGQLYIDILKGNDKKQALKDVRKSIV